MSKIQLVKNHHALEIYYIPDNILYRREQMRELEEHLERVFSFYLDSGELYGAMPNLLLIGDNGIGKTLVSKKIFRDYKRKTEDKYPNINMAYIECVEHKTITSVLNQLSEQLKDLKFWKNDTKEAKFQKFREWAESSDPKKVIILIFDEFDRLFMHDKVDAEAFFSFLLRQIKNCNIITITNNKYWNKLIPNEQLRTFLDVFNPKEIQFPPYNFEEFSSITQDRIELAFQKNVIDDLVIHEITKLAYRHGASVRAILDLLKLSVRLTEQEGNDKITMEIFNKIKDMDQFKGTLYWLKDYSHDYHLVVIALATLQQRGNGLHSTAEINEQYNNIYKIESEYNNIVDPPVTYRTVFSALNLFNRDGLIESTTKGRKLYHALQSDPLKVIDAVTEICEEKKCVPTPYWRIVAENE